MTTYISKEVQEGLNEARYRLNFDGSMYPVLKLWDTGFSLDAEAAPNMRGLVDLFEGTNHLSLCLIIAFDKENGEVKFKFKRITPPSDKAALDFARRLDAPVAFLN